jgi:hypothetical protein
MIMGNTNIPLPTNVIENNPDPSIGIPDGPAPQESRSVLKDKITDDSPPASLSHGLASIQIAGLEGHEGNQSQNK